MLRHSATRVTRNSSSPILIIGAKIAGEGAVVVVAVATKTTNNSNISSVAVIVAADATKIATVAAGKINRRSATWRCLLKTRLTNRHELTSLSTPFCEVPAFL